MTKHPNTEQKIRDYLKTKKGNIPFKPAFDFNTKGLLIATLPCLTLSLANVNGLHAQTSTNMINMTTTGTPEGSFSINLDGAGGNDAFFDMTVNGMVAGPGSAASIHIHDTASNWFEKLPYGQNVTAGASFNIVLNGNNYGGFSFDTVGCTSPWEVDGSGFLGVKFLISGNLHLGWIGLEVTSRQDVNGDVCNSNAVANFGRKFRIIKAGWLTTSIAGGGNSITTPATLPVTFTTFKARPELEKIHLIWQTSSEIENAGFEIERSTDGQRFYPISFVEGVGNTTDQQSYTFDDEDVIRGQMYYYRLKQVDFDGKHEHSHIVSAKLENQAPTHCDFYPNPSADGTTHLSYSTIQSGILNLEVFDMSGKALRSLQREVIAGQNILELDFRGVGKGMFFVKLQQDAFHSYKKLIIGNP